MVENLGTQKKKCNSMQPETTPDLETNWRALCISIVGTIVPKKAMKIAKDENQSLNFSREELHVRNTEQKEQDIMNYISRYTLQNNRPPELKEIAKACYMSCTNVHWHINKLIGQGKISKEYHSARSIKIISKKD